MARSVILVSALGCALAAGCSRPLDREQSLRNAREQAEALAQAAVGQDHETAADLAHPALVQALGGRDRYVAKLSAVAAELNGQGVRLTGFRFAEPLGIAEAGGAVYVVMPYDLDMEGPGDAHFVQPTYLVGESRDRGRTWKFVDGGSAEGDRAKIKRVLPDFPDELPVPPRQAPLKQGAVKREP